MHDSNQSQSVLCLLLNTELGNLAFASEIWSERIGRSTGDAIGKLSGISRCARYPRTRFHRTLGARSFRRSLPDNA
jgi:hypothetical protein